MESLTAETVARYRAWHEQAKGNDMGKLTNAKEIVIDTTNKARIATTIKVLGRVEAHKVRKDARNQLGIDAYNERKAAKITKPIKKGK